MRPSLPQVAPLPEVTVRLNRFIPGESRHYFTGVPERPNYKSRKFDFWGSPEMMPLVRAYLDTCAADQSREYRYLFTLLGSELANNAMAHTRSGGPEGVYTLLAKRFPSGLKLICRDAGTPTPDGTFRSYLDREYLSADPAGLDPEADTGRGLALIEALATSWGDNGVADGRQVWFYLAYDLEGSAWLEA